MNTATSLHNWDPGDNKIAELGREEMAIGHLEPQPCSWKGHKNQVNARSVKETALGVDSTIEREICS